MNDLNYARFEATLDQRVAEIRMEFAEMRGGPARRARRNTDGTP